MSEPSLSVRPRTQLAAIAGLRWRLFVNALRTTRGKLELLSQILIGFAFAIGGPGGAFRMGRPPLMMTSARQPGFFSPPLWVVFFFWQIFPNLASASAHN